MCDKYLYNIKCLRGNDNGNNMYLFKIVGFLDFVHRLIF